MEKFSQFRDRGKFSTNEDIVTIEWLRLGRIWHCAVPPCSSPTIWLCAAAPCVSLLLPSAIACDRLSGLLCCPAMASYRFVGEKTIATVYIGGAEPLVG